MEGSFVNSFWNGTEEICANLAVGDHLEVITVLPSQRPSTLKPRYVLSLLQDK